MTQNQHSIPRLSAEETERIRRTPGHSGHAICGMVIGSSWHEPVACAYPPGHTGDHSWASIPQFDPAKEPVVGTPEPDYSGYGTRQEMRKEIVFLQEQRRRLEEQFETVQRVAKEAVAYYIADVVPDPAQRYVDDWCEALGVTREELDALYWSDEPHVSSPAKRPT